MGWRASHGASARSGRVVASEPRPSDELSYPSGSASDSVRPDRGSDGRFVAGNGVARRAKFRAGPMGTLAALSAKADPSWQAARRWGHRAATHRISELARIHGGELSSSVCGLVEEEWELRADAKYLRARAASDDNPELLRLAATLSAGARQAARDSWEFCIREAQARPQRHENLHRQLAEAFGGKP